MSGYSPNTWEIEAGRSGIQGHFWLQSKFQASSRYLRPCLKKADDLKCLFLNKHFK